MPAHALNHPDLTVANPAEETEAMLLPEGHYIDLPGRGRCFYRELPNPGKPTLVLLHGMLCSALTNWHQCFHHLAPHFHIIAPDLRGHGRSFRTARSFKLRSCAKDISALLNTLEINEAILVGYSMGGAVVQHLMRDYPDQVGGAVLSATGFRPQGVGNRAVAIPAMTTLVMMSRLSRFLTAAPSRVIAQLVPVLNVKDRDYESLQSAMLDELRRTPLRLSMEAGREMMLHDSADWLPLCHQPSAVLVTREDAIFSVEEQEELVRLLPQARQFNFTGNHRSCMHSLYGVELLNACQDVARRIDQHDAKK